MLVGSTTAGVPTDTFWNCTGVGFIAGLGYQRRPQEAVGTSGCGSSTEPFGTRAWMTYLWIRLPGMWAYRGP